MYNEDGIIKAVELAPNGVVRSVYPRAGNADALGLNMLRHPERKVEASLGRTAEKPEITCREEILICSLYSKQ